MSEGVYGKITCRVTVDFSAALQFDLSKSIKGYCQEIIIGEPPELDDRGRWVEEPDFVLEELPDELADAVRCKFNATPVLQCVFEADCPSASWEDVAILGRAVLSQFQRRLHIDNSKNLGCRIEMTVAGHERRFITSIGKI